MHTPTSFSLFTPQYDEHSAHVVFTAHHDSVVRTPVYGTPQKTPATSHHHHHHHRRKQGKGQNKEGKERSVRNGLDQSTTTDNVSVDEKDEKGKDKKNSNDTSTPIQTIQYGAAWGQMSQKNTKENRRPEAHCSGNTPLLRTPAQAPVSSSDPSRASPSFACRSNAHASTTTTTTSPAPPFINPNALRNERDDFFAARDDGVIPQNDASSPTVVHFKRPPPGLTLPYGASHCQTVWPHSGEWTTTKNVQMMRKSGRATGRSYDGREQTVEGERTAASRAERILMSSDDDEEYHELEIEEEDRIDNNRIQAPAPEWVAGEGNGIAKEENVKKSMKNTGKQGMIAHANGSGEAKKKRGNRMREKNLVELHKYKEALTLTIPDVGVEAYAQDIKHSILGHKGANIKQITNVCKACYIYLHVIDDYSLAIQVSAPFFQGFLQCRQMTLDLINSVWVSMFNVAVFWPTTDPTVEAALAAVTGTVPFGPLPQAADWPLAFSGSAPPLLDSPSPQEWSHMDVSIQGNGVLGRRDNVKKKAKKKKD